MDLFIGQQCGDMDKENRFMDMGSGGKQKVGQWRVAWRHIQYYIYKIEAQWEFLLHDSGTRARTL